MEVQNKRVFWQALIIALAIFAFGILLGYMMESFRVNKILTLYQQSELDMLDVKIQSDIFGAENINCNQSYIELLSFADRVYEQANLLSRYEESSRLQEGLKVQHKKYDLLRTMLWVNALNVQEKCSKKDFHIVVYFYEYLSEDQEIKGMQEAFAKKLSALKNLYGEKVLLIPLAGNMDSNSLSYLMQTYNVYSLPSVLVDQKFVLDSTEDIKNIETFFK